MKTMITVAIGSMLAFALNANAGTAQLAANAFESLQSSKAAKQFENELAGKTGVAVTSSESLAKAVSSLNPSDQAKVIAAINAYASQVQTKPTSNQQIAAAQIAATQQLGGLVASLSTSVAANTAAKNDVVSAPTCDQDTISVISKKTGQNEAAVRSVVGTVIPPEAACGAILKNMDADKLTILVKTAVGARGDLSVDGYSKAMVAAFKDVGVTMSIAEAAKRVAGLEASECKYLRAQ
jgi:hypothetical protein